MALPVTLTVIDAHSARRVAVDAALLTSELPSTGEGILAVARHFGGIQIDPTRTVERTQHLVLWSRLAGYDRKQLEQLLAERQLIEWNAFIVPLERLPELLYVARSWPPGGGDWRRRARDFLTANEAFSKSILDQLRDRGPLQSRDIDDSKVVAGWTSSGWTQGKSTSQMLEFMSAQARVFVAGRVGQERLWDLPERVIPADAPRDELSESEYEERRVLRAMKRFGIATFKEIRLRAYGLSVPAARTLLAGLVADGRIEAVRVESAAGDVDAFALPGATEAAELGPRTTLLSPFDPLIYDRERTERIFGFSYKLEMYVPKAERKFGHFVLPIVQGDALIGRLDSGRDKSGAWAVNKIHWQDGEPDAATRTAVDAAIADLAAFVKSGT